MVELRVQYIRDEQPNPSTIQKGIYSVLERGADAGLLRVAEKEGKVVGWAMVFMEVSEWRAGLVWYLKSITADPKNCDLQEIVDALYFSVHSEMKESPTSNGLRVYTHSASHDSPIKQNAPPAVATPVGESLRNKGPLEVEHYYMMSDVKPEFKKYSNSL